jgi:hypothetical protein
MTLRRDVCLLLALAAPAAAVYKLTFLSDFQEGAFDTDAAEHVGYDVGSQRAFVASAESGNVIAIDLADPASPEHKSTLSVASDFGFFCEEQDCSYEGMDFGGDGTPCGYADTLRIVANDAAFSCCSWFSGTIEVDATMDSAGKCQTLCENDAACSYWSYEDECLAVDKNGGEVCADDGTRYHECYLKSTYTLAQATTAGEGSVADCVDYAVWEGGAHWNDHSYDENWVGASGPSECGNVVAESVQSVATATVDGYPNGVVVAASPHKFEWANGYLAFYDAKTLNYLGCEEAGIKPEGITSMGNKVACINEGSAREDGLMDHEGSMTMCEMTVTSNPTAVSPSCTTYGFQAANFATGAFLSSQEYRYRDLRLYGPNGNRVDRCTHQTSRRLPGSGGRGEPRRTHGLIGTQAPTWTSSPRAARSSTRTRSS